MTLAVLFDLDDTLYDHQHAIRAALAEVALEEPRLLHGGLEALLARYGEALEDVHPHVVAGRISYAEARVERYRRLLEWAEADVSLATELADVQFEAYRRHERLVPGAEGLIEALTARGLALGIVSNSTRDEQFGKLSRLGVDGCFHAVVVSGDHGISKPDPRLFDIALRALKVPALEAAFVGDRWDIDVLGARAAGMRPIWLNRAGAASPDPAIASISSLEGDEALHAILGSCA